MDAIQLMNSTFPYLNESYQNAGLQNGQKQLGMKEFVRADHR
jgi:hypothetical protein